MLQQLESEAVANKTRCLVFPVSSKCVDFKEALFAHCSFKGTRNSSTALQQVKDYQKAQNKEKLSFQVMGMSIDPSRVLFFPTATRSHRRF